MICTKYLGSAYTSQGNVDLVLGSETGAKVPGDQKCVRLASRYKKPDRRFVCISTY
jgi:hypothetical protein